MYQDDGFGLGLLLIIGAVALISGIAASNIALGKGRDANQWFLLGVFFGPFAVLAAAVTSRETSANIPSSNNLRRPCPYCAEEIRSEAVKCRFCGSDVIPVSAPEADVSAPEAEVSQRKETVHLSNEEIRREKISLTLFIILVFVSLIAIAAAKLVT